MRKTCLHTFPPTTYTEIDPGVEDVLEFFVVSDCHSIPDARAFYAHECAGALSIRRFRVRATCVVVSLARCAMCRNRHRQAVYDLDYGREANV